MFRIQADRLDHEIEFIGAIDLARYAVGRLGPDVGIPMMSISHSDLMPIRTERSDAGLSQCEIVIDIRQEFCWFS